jgi:hypothetical protein
MRFKRLHQQTPESGSESEVDLQLSAECRLATVRDLNDNDEFTRRALARGATVLPFLGGGLPEISDFDPETFGRCLDDILARLRNASESNKEEYQKEPK